MDAEPKRGDLRRITHVGFVVSMCVGLMLGGATLFLLPGASRPYILVGGLAAAAAVSLIQWATLRELDEHTEELARRNDRLRVIAERLGLSLKSVQESYAQTIQALSATVEAKDPYTAGHAERVATLAEATAEVMGLGLYDQDLVRRAGLLHDLGKIGVRDSILGKEGPLTSEEFDEVRRHSEVGARIVSVMRSMQPLAPLIRHHHEYWDGAGYPDGLAGEDIPLGARILAVADAYDAMTSDRPYRSAMTPADALTVLRETAGHQFDPRAVDAFFEAATAWMSAGAEDPWQASQSARVAYRVHSAPGVGRERRAELTEPPALS